MVVHAHPDDESLGSGGTLQHYGRRGVRTVVVICTGGEAGEISDPALATPETLGEVRRREAEAATAILGVDRLCWLGYRDSGMAGTADNVDPRSNVERMRELTRAAGVERRREGESDEEEERRFRERLLRFAVPDDAVTTLVDIREFVDRKREAVLAHRTQIGPESRHARTPEDLRRPLWTPER